MNDRHLYLFSRELLERVSKCFYRAVYVTFKNNIQLFEVTESNASPYLVESDVALRTY